MRSYFLKIFDSQILKPLKAINLIKLFDSQIILFKKVFNPQKNLVDSSRSSILMPKIYQRIVKILAF